MNTESINLRKIVFGGLTLYLFSWLIGYGQTPLGSFPALDCLQNQVLAQQIVSGTLPQEPFHRAPLYPVILAGALWVVGDVGWLPDIGRLINGLAVLFAAGCAYRAGKRLWGRESAGLIAAVLLGANPVVLFFAGDLYDITLAMAIAAACVWAWIVWLERPKLRLTLLISLLLGAGAMLRSHLLPWALLWPIIATLLGGRSPIRWIHGGLAYVGLALALLLTGCINLWLTDTWRTSPWQGAYALWAGNEAEADGRIYKQSRAIEHLSDFDNPAKLLSIELYAEATAAEPPYDIDAMNAYWMRQAGEEISADPFRWLGLMLRKAYYFINSYEQYDNRTFGLHRSLHAHLVWNPIHWGLLVLLTVAALFVPRASGGPTARVLATLFIAYAAGIILFYASNRFRVPLLPLLAVTGGGAVMGLPRVFRSMPIYRLFALFGSCGVISLLLYTSWFDARNTDTWEADYLMLARVATQVGDDTASSEYIEAALEVNPTSRQALLLQVMNNFNKWALQETPQLILDGQARALLIQAEAQARWSDEAAAVAGIYAWKLGRTDDAAVLWSAYPSSAFCWMARVWTSRGEDRPSREQAEVFAKQRYAPFLMSALNGIESGADAEDIVWLQGLFAPIE